MMGMLGPICLEYRNYATIEIQSRGVNRNYNRCCQYLELVV